MENDFNKSGIKDKLFWYAKTISLKSLKVLLTVNVKIFKRFSGHLIHLLIWTRENNLGSIISVCMVPYTNL